MFWIEWKWTRMPVLFLLLSLCPLGRFTYLSYLPSSSKVKDNQKCWVVTRISSHFLFWYGAGIEGGFLLWDTESKRKKLVKKNSLLYSKWKRKKKKKIDAVDQGWDRLWHTWVEQDKLAANPYPKTGRQSGRYSGTLGYNPDCGDSTIQLKRHTLGIPPEKESAVSSHWPTIHCR